MAKTPQESDDKRKPNGQFGPGNRANPGGRPKGRSTAAILRKLYDKSNKDHPGKTNHEVVLERVLDMALGGDKWAIDFITDRTEGRPIQTQVNVPDTSNNEVVVA